MPLKGGNVVLTAFPPAAHLPRCWWSRSWLWMWEQLPGGSSAGRSAVDTHQRLAYNHVRLETSNLFMNNRQTDNRAKPCIISYHIISYHFITTTAIQNVLYNASFGTVVLILDPEQYLILTDTWQYWLKMLQNKFEHNKDTLPLQHLILHSIADSNQEFLQIRLIVSLWLPFAATSLAQMLHFAWFWSTL